MSAGQGKDELKSTQKKNAQAATEKEKKDGTL